MYISFLYTYNIITIMNDKICIGTITWKLIHTMLETFYINVYDFEKRLKQKKILKSSTLKRKRNY